MFLCRLSFVNLCAQRWAMHTNQRTGYSKIGQVQHRQVWELACLCFTTSTNVNAPLCVCMCGDVCLSVACAITQPTSTQLPEACGGADKLVDRRISSCPEACGGADKLVDRRISSCARQSNSVSQSHTLHAQGPQSTQNARACPNCLLRC